MVSTVVVCMGSTACGAAAVGSAGNTTPQPGGVLRYGAYSEMRGFDPVKLTSVGTGIERAAAVMDTLLYRDEITDEVKPKLAESIHTTDNGTTWVLGLRDGVTFTDGEPLNAEAVIFNVNRRIARRPRRITEGTRRSGKLLGESGRRRSVHAGLLGSRRPSGTRQERQLLERGTTHASHGVTYVLQPTTRLGPIDEHPYGGSTMAYLDSAWLDR